MQLTKLANFSGRPGPLFIIVLDGVGIGPEDEGNAVHLAHTPTLDMLRQKYLYCQLKAHGTAVGMPSDDDMGNSEVGHNALGAGRVFDQGSKLVGRAIADGSIFRGKTWCDLVANCKQHNTPMHLIGLLSDGNVHSHIDQIFALIKKADEEGIAKLFLHVLLDGRDVSETSALQYIDATEALLTEINQKGERCYKIASGGGRMKVTMDRYEAEWDMVERGWRAHVLGEERPFSSAREAIETFRNETPGIIDQFLPAFTIVENGSPVGLIEDNHSVIFFNFRGDRAIEITRAFEEAEFTKFDRKKYPQVKYAGMMQYDGDLKLPKAFLVDPPQINNTMGEYLARNQVSQYAISETQKYGHVTYFWNGNRSGMFDSNYETYKEIPSDRIPFEQRPWMKAAEITDSVIEHVSQHPDTGLVRINYANGDMVGHTGDLYAAILSVEATDLSLKRLLKFVEKIQGIAIVLADHGNADEMYEKDKKGKFQYCEATQRYKMKTSHTLNPVPFVIYDPIYNKEYVLRDLPTRGLSNVAATAFNLMGYQAPEIFDPSLVEFSE